jgi:hypothetical protein
VSRFRSSHASRHAHANFGIKGDTSKCLAKRCLRSNIGDPVAIARGRDAGPGGEKHNPDQANRGIECRAGPDPTSIIVHRTALDLQSLNVTPITTTGSARPSRSAEKIIRSSRTSIWIGKTTSAVTKVTNARQADWLSPAALAFAPPKKTSQGARLWAAVAPGDAVIGR